MNLAERKELFLNTTHLIKILLGDAKGKGRQVSSSTQFGTYGYSFSVWTDHIDFLKKINGIIDNVRWKLLNSLLITHYESTAEEKRNLIIQQAENLAALVAFPVLEEAAMKIFNAWDDNGNLLIDVPEAFGLTDRKGGKIVRKKGDRVVHLSYKLQIMLNFLDNGLKATIVELDKRMRKSFIEGLDEELKPLFNKLEFHRDLWAHGRKMMGWEAIFITLLLFMIYVTLKEKKL